MATPGSAASSEQSGIIAALVAEMKSGNISKTELFEQLSRLHRGGPSAVTIQVGEPAPAEPGAASGSTGGLDPANDADGAGDDDQAPPAPAAPRSSGMPTPVSESSKQAVEALIERKRQERSRRTQPSAAYEAAAEPSASGNAPARSAAAPAGPAKLTMEEFMAQAGGRETKTPANSRAKGRSMRRRPASARRARPSPSGNRMSRHERRELKLKNEAMKECTFHPQITELPHSYSAAHSYMKMDFHSRVMGWKKAKDADLIQRRENQALSQMDQCTFQPEINMTSRQAARRSRTPQHKSVVERLYTTSRKNTRNAEAELRRKREEEFRRTCTFQPNLGSSKRRTPSRGRVRSQQKRDLSRGRGNTRRNVAQPTGLEECTFQPKVNPVSNRFQAARLYLQNNVHDRLSTPLPKSHDDADSKDNADVSGVLDADSFLNSMDAKTARTKTKQRRPQSARRSRESAEDRRKSFQDFLSRQNQRQLRRNKNIEDMKKQASFSHKPRICQRSRAIARATSSGDFMERLAKDSLRKEHGKMKQKAELARQERCTFRPNILASSRARKARTVTEMSRGDSLKRETSTRLMKLKAEQDELKGLTFKPKLNPSSAKSRLNILKDPDTYLERIQKQEELFSVRRRKALQEQEMKEFAECTFHPKIHAAPAYISRIAKSMELARQARPKVEKSDKPDWK